MPAIPGLATELPPVEARVSVRRAGTRLLVTVVLALAVGSVASWLFLRHPGSAPATSPPAIAEEPSPPAPAPIPSPISRSGPRVVATLDELASPWSSKEFTFVRPGSEVEVPALVIRLPGIPGNRNDAYWAFSLEAPYGRCQLEYVRNVREIGSRYRYPATHPVVAAPCDGTIYDPLRLGTTPSGAWVRGEVVQGPGIRPPFLIQITVRGRSIVAERVE